MQTILLLLDPLALVLGSLIAAVLLCWGLSAALTLLRLPELELPIVLAAVALAITGHLPTSAFLEMTLAFAVVGAVVSWFTARTWRREHGRPGAA